MIHPDGRKEKAPKDGIKIFKESIFKKEEASTEEKKPKEESSIEEKLETQVKIIRE